MALALPVVSAAPKPDISVVADASKVPIPVTIDQGQTQKTIVAAVAPVTATISTPASAIAVKVPAAITPATKTPIAHIDTTLLAGTDKKGNASINVIANATGTGNVSASASASVGVDENGQITIAGNDAANVVDAVDGLHLDQADALKLIVGNIS